MNTSNKKIETQVKTNIYWVLLFFALLWQHVVRNIHILKAVEKIEDTYSIYESEEKWIAGYNCWTDEGSRITKEM